MKQNRIKLNFFTYGLICATTIFVLMGANYSRTQTDKEEVGRYQLNTNFTGKKNVVYRLDTKYGDLHVYTPVDNFYDVVDFNSNTWDRVSLKVHR